MNFNKLIPAGTEKVSLWEVTEWDKNFREVEKSKQKSIWKLKTVWKWGNVRSLSSLEGNIAVLTSSSRMEMVESSKIDHTYDEGEGVTLSYGGAPNIKYFCGKFVNVGNRTARSKDTNLLSNRFLYWALKYDEPLIDDYYRGSGLRHVNLRRLLDHELPLPSLEVQNQIVEILDAHNLLAELQEERVQLLKLEKDILLEKIFAPEGGFKFSLNGKSFDTGEWYTYRFQERFNSIRHSGGVGNRNLENTGRYPVISQSQRPIDGFTDAGNLISASAEDPVIIFGDHTTIVKFSDEPFVVGGPGVKLFTVRDGDPRFFYEALRQNGPVPNGYRRHSSMLTTCNFIAPGLEDQRLISDYFREVDRRIKLEEERLQLLKIQQEVVLEQIFSK